MNETSETPSYPPLGKLDASEFRNVQRQERRAERDARAERVRLGITTPKKKPRQRRPVFSYAFVQDEDTRAIKDKLVAHLAKQFVVWRARSETRKGLDLEKAFGAWWRIRGPVNFAENEDGRLLRKEVLDYATNMQTPDAA